MKIENFAFAPFRPGFADFAKTVSEQKKSRIHEEIEKGLFFMPLFDFGDPRNFGDFGDLK